MIHAYLAADRPAPKVAAGISMGALSAAALERCYRELPPPSTEPSEVEPAEREVGRWRWYRRYLDAITNSPLDIIWNAIPDPIDFFADKPPVADLSVKPFPQTLQDEEHEARTNYYRLVKLGLWLAGLRISVADVARCAVSWVRYKERYGLWFWQMLRFYASWFIIGAKLLVHFCFTPQFIIEKTKWARGRSIPRPLFGWPAWIVAVAILANATYLVLKGLVLVAPLLKTGIDKNMTWLSKLLSMFGSGASLVAPYLPLLSRLADLVQKLAVYNSLYLRIVWSIWALAGIGLAYFVYFRTGGPLRYLLQRLGISRGLLHQYALHRRLLELFREGPSDMVGTVIGSPPDPNTKPGVPPKHPPGSMHLLIVAAPLQPIARLNSQQVWAAPGTPVVDALLAALAVPGVFPPRVVTNGDVKHWVSQERSASLPKRLDLIDGSAVRQNPLPALFSWLRTHQAVAEELGGDDPQDAGIHLVYNVPTQPYKQDAQKAAAERLDIVSAAFASLELARRRDTKMECRQTNFLSELELWVRRAEAAPPLQAVAAAAPGGSSAHTTVTSTSTTKTHPYTAFPIFADEIAPERDIMLENNLAPGRDQLLDITACGCRRALETLYRERLSKLKDVHNQVSCHRLLEQVATGRAAFITEQAPGLSEVCAACTRKLEYRQPDNAPPKDVAPVDHFPHLNGARPRIVFVASGGVFRGAFHIGVIGAMRAAGIQPDLIVGASVGTLMGGALAAITKLGGDNGWRLLGKLCQTFLHVDKKIALTRTLKNASKQLGVRTRSVHLSPAQLRRMVRRGTRADAGYAVVGAPPALIDALSTVFLIPHNETGKVASRFVAGHITEAMNMFWSSVRTETLRRLNIETALMGTSLIETAARTLLGQDHGIPLDNPQPYHNGTPVGGISFFGTTSDLNERRALLMSRDLDLKATTSYDFVKAGLSSSAFPVVFSPRQEAEVVPGLGATNVLFADGGMFDNLPFFPAIEILNSVQRQYRQRLNLSAHQALAQRCAQPDLFIAAALESPADPNKKIEHLGQIQRRGASLKVNIKLDSFYRTSKLVDSQVQRLVQVSEGKMLPQGLPDFMDEVVSSAVLKIVPTDSDHLNRTFAFCSALGMERKTIAKSIADGCFQTLETLFRARRTNASLEHRAVSALQDAQRIKIVEAVAEKGDGHHCPFFTAGGERFACPFVQAAQSGDWVKKEEDELRSIYHECTGDDSHRKRHKKPRAKSAAVSRAGAPEGENRV
jgi:predicted acylesterase/phospholipase RssA